MKKIDACKLRRKGGFTLVELIVVLVMLAVLSAVAVPTYLGFVDDNKAKQCETHRKALASRLEEMSAMGSTASLTEEVLNSDENGCPAGGNYTLTPSADGEINSMTIECSEHGSTTVLLKNNSQVTAKSSTETEKKVEKEPEKTETNPPSEPKFSITVNREKAEMEVDEEQILTASVVVQNDCTPTGSYTWTVPANFQKIEDNGSSIKIKAISAGTLCNVSCQSSATVADGSSLSASGNTQVTVKELKNLAVSLDPKSVELTLGEAGKASESLTANVEISGYNSYDCVWTIDKGEVARVTQITGDQTKVSVTGLSGGTATVLCTVTADNGAATATDTATITVKENETEAPEISTADFLINGRASNEETITVWLNTGNCPDLARLSLPSGGRWSSSDDAVTVVQDIGEVKIKDEFRGGTYNFVYTAPNGDIYNITGRVVYPITGIEYGFHIGSWPEGSAKGEDKGKYEINVEDTADMWIGYTPAHTTDRGSIEWKSSDTSVAVIDRVRTIDTFNLENRGYNIATIRVLKPGKTTISWTVDNEHEKTRETRSQELTVIDPTQLSKIRVDSMKLKMGDTPKIQPVCEPEGASLKNITFTYSGDGDCISIDTDGTIHALKNGLATVTVQALKNGESLEGCSCSFDVAVTDLNSISVNPSTVEMSQSESKSAQIICDPPTADTSSVRYVLSYDTNALTITEEQRLLTIKANYGGWVNVKAFMGNVQVAETSFEVKLASSGNDVELTGIHLELKNGLPNIMQGKTAKIVLVQNDGDLIVHAEPDYVDLSMYKLYAWTNNSNIAYVQNQTDLYGNNIGQTTLYIQLKKDGTNIEKTVQTTINVIENTNTVTDLYIDSNKSNLMIGEEATIAVAPNSADFVIRSSSGDESLEGFYITEIYPSNDEWGRLSRKTNENVIIGGGTTGEVVLNVKISNFNGKEYVAQATLNIVANPDKPVNYNVNGSILSSTPWNVLRDYIKQKSETSPPLGIFAASSSELYVLKENAQLKWNSGYETLSFAEYLNSDNNIEEFVRVDVSQITWDGNTFSGDVGKLLGKNNGYYVCVKSVPESERNNTGNWSEDFLKEYFIKIS